VRKEFLFLGANIVFRQKSEIVRKMALLRAPVCFPHRKETYGSSENVGCFS
jgi:hypothetical protein